MWKFKDRDDLRHKIEWEGGIYEALEYGIHAEAMPEGDTELLEAWTALEESFNTTATLAGRVELMLEGEGGARDVF